MICNQLAEYGPAIFRPTVHGDERGFFMETFRQNEFEAECGSQVFVQDNHSRSRRNVLRGLHYQLEKPQGKLVRVTSGRVFDVAVDLRLGSPTFGKYFYALLDDKSRDIFWVPPGFAHGFLVLSDMAEFVYKCTTYYAPEDEHCLLWNDPALGIAWPLAEAAATLPPAESEPQTSAKDKQGLPLAVCPKYNWHDWKKGPGES